MIAARRRLPALLILAGLVSCGEARRFGDSDGVPVPFTVQVDRAFFDTMSNRQVSTSVGAGAGFTNHGYSGMGLGLGLGFTSTTVFLLGGDAPGQANVFRQELKWGDNSFSVPLRPGRVLVLSVQAEGGRNGWEALGTITIPDADAPGVRVTMDANGGKVIATAATATSSAATDAARVP